MRQFSGEPISAQTINKLKDGERRTRHNNGAGAPLRDQPGGHAQRARAPHASARRDGGAVLNLVNSGATDLAPYQPCEIVGSFYPGTGAERYSDVEVETATLDAVGNFAVTREQIPAGQAGHGFLSGVCLCRVQTDPAGGDLYADIANLGDDFLTGDAHIGTAQILWEDGGPSATTHLAMIRFPSGASTGGNASARAKVTSASDSHSGLAARDGVTPVDGDIVFDAVATAGADRGLWVAHSGAWTRSADWIVPGMLVTVREGTAGKDTVWMLETDAPIVVGTTALSFKQVNQASNYVVVQARGSSLTHSGTQTIDGSACGVGALVFDVADGKVYTVASGAWTVFTSTAVFVYVSAGTVYANVVYVQAASGSYFAISGCYA